MVSGSVDSGRHKLSENAWSNTSYSGDKWRCHRCRQTTSEYSATQLLICEKLSLAIKHRISQVDGEAEESTPSSPLSPPPPSKPSPLLPEILKKPVKMLNGDPVSTKKK